MFFLHIGNDPSGIQDFLDQGREGLGLDPLSFGHVMDEARMIDPRSPKNCEKEL